MTTQTISEKILSAHCGHPEPFGRFAVALNYAVSPTAGAVPPTITEDTDGVGDGGEVVVR